MSDNDVPIVGQLVKIKSWFPTVCVVCNCSEPGEPLLLVSANATPCPKCQRKYVIGGVHYMLGQAPKIMIAMASDTAPPS